MKNKVRVLLTRALNRVFDPDIASRVERCLDASDVNLEDGRGREPEPPAEQTDPR